MINLLTIALLIVIVTFTAFAIALCRIIARADVEREWFYEMRDDQRSNGE